MLHNRTKRSFSRQNRFWAVEKCCVCFSVPRALLSKKKHSKTMFFGNEINNALALTLTLTLPKEDFQDKTVFQQA